MAERKLNPASQASASGLLRCFVGQPLASASARRLMLAWRAIGAAGWREIAPDNLHLTLLFVGHVERASVPNLLDHVSRLGGRGTRARAVAFVGLPGDAHATVAAAELLPDRRWTDWRARLAGGLGLPADRFRPHVTVARRRNGMTFAPQALAVPITIQLGAPRLFRSVTTPAGVHYDPLDTAAG
jgi:2'-5' RNA ligase